jgi:hypothetical protein
MAKVVVTGTLVGLYYRGVELTTRLVYPALELQDDTVYILSARDAKKLQNNNLGTIVELPEFEMTPNVEVSYNEETSVLQITRKPPEPVKPPVEPHVLDAVLDDMFNVEDDANVEDSAEANSDDTSIPDASLDDLLGLT